MPNSEHLRILQQGVHIWNKWREDTQPFMPNLRRANLSGWDLSHADLHDVYLRRANLKQANLSFADLREANLSGANLTGANLTAADLAGANLRGARARRSLLTGANLMSAILVETDLRDADLSECQVYGTTSWAIRLQGANQSNLRITHPNESVITVDDLELAQFIYLILKNQKIRGAIDIITSKVVLILGRFKPERKVVLDAIHHALRQRNYVPVLFDFDKPTSLDLTETITLLARMAKFLIVDLTEPSSVPQEIQAIVPDVAVPVVPILEGRSPYSMFVDYRKYHWVIRLHRYKDAKGLIDSFDEQVIAPAEAKYKELVIGKNQAVS